MRPLPKKLRQPVGCSVEDEPDEAKGLRLLAAFRYIIERNIWTLGITIGDAQFMIIRYRPKPDGPHHPDADLSGTEL